MTALSQRANTLAKNTAIFALGNFGSKLLQILLVPYYTRVLTSAQFGTADILHSAVSLLFPIISLLVYEAVFRFAMDKNQDKTAVFSIGMVVTLTGSAVIVIIGLIIGFLSNISYLWSVILSSVFHALRSLYSQYTKAINKTFLFAIDNILFTLEVLILNIFFISVFKLGITGYMLGYTLANAFSCLFLHLFLKENAKFKISSLNLKLFKTLIFYSAPLILNSVCWWLGNFTSRFVITFYLGVTANGIFTASNKIPSLLSVVVSVFFSAWQITANNEFESEDSKDFYTKIYNHIFATVITVASVLIILCRPITKIFLGRDFWDSWKYMPTLLIAMSFFAFSQFLGSIYCANKKTSMAFLTNLICVIVCVILNLSLIKPFGIMGCAVATAVSYFFLWISRILTTRKILKIKYNFTLSVVAVMILIVEAVLISFNIRYCYTISAIGTVILLFLFRKIWGQLLMFIFSSLKGKRYAK